MEPNNKLYKCYKPGCNKADDSDNPFLTQSEYDDLIKEGKMICPENHEVCGIQELKHEDYPKRQKPKTPFFLIGGTILVVLLIVGGVFTYINIQKNKVKDVVEIGKTIVEKSKGVGEILGENINKLVKEADSFFENKDFDNAKIAFNAILSIDPDNQHAKQYLSEISKIIDSQSKGGKGEVVGRGKDESTLTSSSSVQTIIFPNGDKYVGKMKNGKMHDDLGTFYYNNDQIISDKDLKKRKAMKGDYLIGEWYEGNVVKGKLYDSNNSPKEVIIIGR